MRTCTEAHSLTHSLTQTESLIHSLDPDHYTTWRSRPENHTLTLSSLDSIKLMIPPPSQQQGPRACSGIVFVLVLFLLHLRVGLGLLGGWSGGSGFHSDGICWVRLQQRHDFGLALARENPPAE